jgi:hypothetical protein
MATKMPLPKATLLSPFVAGAEAVVDVGPGGLGLGVGGRGEGEERAEGEQGDVDERAEAGNEAVQHGAARITRECAALNTHRCVESGREVSESEREGESESE